MSSGMARELRESIGYVRDAGWHSFAVVLERASPAIVPVSVYSAGRLTPTWPPTENCTPGSWSKTSALSLTATPPV